MPPNRIADARTNETQPERRPFCPAAPSLLLHRNELVIAAIERNFWSPPLPHEKKPVRMWGRRSPWDQHPAQIPAFPRPPAGVLGSPLPLKLESKLLQVFSVPSAVRANPQITEVHRPLPCLIISSYSLRLPKNCQPNFFRACVPHLVRELLRLTTHHNGTNNV